MPPIRTLVQVANNYSVRYLGTALAHYLGQAQAADLAKRCIPAFGYPLPFFFRF
jgi:hypothetical protein